MYCAPSGIMAPGSALQRVWSPTFAVMHTHPVKVTVLMTLYNKASYVAEAIQSILNNTFTDFELLVVDDASTDGGPDDVKSFSDTRIRLLESDVNTGRAAAANRGFDEARGEYVAVLDADDISHPERLAKQVAFMDTHPEVGACGSEFQILGGPERAPVRPATDRECRAFMLFGDPVHYQTSMLRRSVLEEHGLRCNAEWRLPGMDYIFILGIAPYAAYANLREPLLTYRMGENNMRHGRHPLEDRARLIQEVFRTLDLPISDRELELQMALHDLFRAPFSAQRVAQLHAWISRLTTMNRERGLFPEDLFEAELERRWKGLFHHFADQDLGAGLAHMRLSGLWRKDRSIYMAKATLNRWTGRKR